MTEIPKKTSASENIVGSVANDFISQGYEEDNYAAEEYIDQPANDECPRILLMGLRRLVLQFVLVLNVILSFQKWKILHSKSSFSQNVSNGNFIFRKY